MARTTSPCRVKAGSTIRLSRISALACLVIPAKLLAAGAAESPDANRSVERELEADEDPFARKQQAIMASSGDRSSYESYSSIRVRHRRTDAQEIWEDFGSRVGLGGWYETAQRQWLFARYELGFNFLEELDFDSQPSRADQEVGSTVFTRLGYVGMQFGGNVIALGKNWSTYYQVAAFTDRFDSVGAQASGTFNARTDGGASGTGRADDVLQGRLKFNAFGEVTERKPLELNLQIQARQEIPEVDGFKYDHAYGISSILRIKRDIDIGIAYSRSTIDVEQIPIELRNGLDGDLSALLLGARWYNDDWYLGATWSRTSNLHTTDTLTYFDGEGVEVYAQHRVLSDVWVLAGMNRLVPGSDQSQAGKYRLEYGVLGVRYLFGGFTRMVYLESRISSGRNQDGTDEDNQVILGIRWGFDADIRR